jgi:LysR family cys regulon transcriptional activator
MNFQQLRIIHETVRRQFNLTEVANALFTSQSGVSKHIKDLEDELGIELFVRKGKRLLGLTEPGRSWSTSSNACCSTPATSRASPNSSQRRDDGQLASPPRTPRPAMRCRGW